MAGSKNKEKKNIGFKFTFFILLLVIIGVATGCLFSPVFDIIDVKTYDGVNISSGEILKIADIPIGNNIFRINDSKIEKQIEQLSYVKSAEVCRLFPSTIFIEYEERKPYAIIKYLESFVVVDKYGYLLEIMKENKMTNLPIIYGIDIDNCLEGTKLQDTSLTKYENCAYLLETASKTNFNYTFKEINYDDSTNVKLYITEKDVDIVYGDVDIDNIEEKLSHLSSILDRLGEKKGKLDMSAEDYLAKTVFTEKK